MMKKVIKKIKARAAKKATKKAATPKKTVVAKKAVRAPKKTVIVRRKTTKKVSIEDISDMIAKEAYRFYEERGCAHGNDIDDWARAEKMVMKSFKR